MSLRFGHLLLLVIAVIVALPIVAAGCLSVVQRDTTKCNAEFPDCQGGLECNLATGLCTAVDGGLPDGFIGIDGSGDMIAGSCTQSSECADSTPICGGGTCRKCQNAADDFECGRHAPTTPRCETASGKCMACRPDTQASDCKDTAPVCDATTLACRKCERNDECMTGVCKGTGACAMVTEIATVNKGVACDNVLGNPYCEIGPAVMGGKPYVRVIGVASPTTYNAVSITASGTDINVTIVGPGRDAAIKATVSQSGGPAVGVSSTVIGRQAVVALEGLDLIGSNGATKSAGVKCSLVAGVASVTIRDSAIHDSGQAGVDSAQCTLVVDRTIVGPSNGGGGIKMVETTYTLTNTVVYNNSGTSVRGLSFDGLSTGTAAFLTVGGNVGGATFEGGVDCGGTTKVIQSSIVAQNSKGAGGSQFTGACSLMNVVTGPDTFANANAAVPAFTGDYHLSTAATNDTCCVDKADAPTTPSHDFDLDHARRPKGVRWDYGAHELK